MTRVVVPGRLEVLILAGPNGADKTTQSRLLVPSGMEFLNGDVVAARLHGEGRSQRAVSVAASRIVLDEMRTSTAAHRSFCVETNLAGRGFVRWVSEWGAAGHEVRLHFTALDSQRAGSTNGWSWWPKGAAWVVTWRSEIRGAGGCCAASPGTSE